jgi:alkanesulfonate monooxygenase SsuD/methylene tetrahydromethanopterin reductase-like flavin-dependent oxidoreductase (luciferase family)
MIKRFHVLYVGQVELENIGLQGTPADARRYRNEKLAEPFFAARDVAQLMDDLGYYALWTAEHHFQREGYECFPNLIQLSLWLATQTRRLKLGCAFNVLPMWHPIRLAEDYAMADIVTDGRVIMGVGRGYHSREVETFGAPVIDQAANRELFEEQVDVMLKCFNDDDWSHHGKQYVRPPSVDYRGYSLTDITCVPRPKHLPVEVWMPIASSKSIDYMASKDFKAMVTLNGEKARVPSLADGIQQKAWFCGPPSHVIEGIKSIEAKYPGLEDFMIHWAEGLHVREFSDQLRWFARDVMPAFTKRG